MTDNEIIQALEQILAASFRGGTFCDVIQNAISLFNRQKAEIERLNKIAIVPPCKIDDPVFFLGKYTGQIVQAYVTGIQKTQHDMFIFVDSGCFFSVNQQLGKSVFLTKEEAQKALEKENQK